MELCVLVHMVSCRAAGQTYETDVEEKVGKGAGLGVVQHSLG